MLLRLLYAVVLLQAIKYLLFAIMLTAPKDPPKDKDPVSPIKILAGGALYHKKPKQAPTIDPQNIEASPTLGI